MASKNITTTAAMVIPKDRRNGVSFLNNGANTVLLRFDGKEIIDDTLDSKNAGIPLAPGAFIDISDADKSANSAQHEIWAATTAGTSDLRYMTR